MWRRSFSENYPDFPVVGLTSCDRESILPLLTPGACSRTATVRSVLQCGCVRLQIPVAELAGETPEYVLVGSHYDSWDYGVTDNATGNAAVLELARVLSQKQLRRGVKIAWWPAHSNGRYAGSTWYCDEQFEDLDARCVALAHGLSRLYRRRSFSSRLPACVGAPGRLRQRIRPVIFGHPSRCPLTLSLATVQAAAEAGGGIPWRIPWIRWTPSF